MSTLGNQLADPKTGRKKYFKLLKNPNVQIYLLSQYILQKKNIVEHIRKLNSNKAWHDIYKMMKLFDDSIAHPLFKIYKICIRKNYFLKNGKWQM